MSAEPLGAKDPEARRERILRATIAVIQERGFAGARVSDIAKEAGTSQGLILYHFGSLAGALASAVALTEEEFRKDVDARLSAADGPIERLCVIAEILPDDDEWQGDWRLWLELWARALRDSDARAVRASLDTVWREWLRSILHDGVERGLFTCADIESSVLRLASLSDGLAVQLALEDPTVTPSRFRELWLGAACIELGLSLDQLVG